MKINNIKLRRIILPRLMNVDILGNDIEVLLKFFLKDNKDLSDEVFDDDKFQPYYEGSDVTILFKYRDSLKNMKKFYEDIHSGIFFDFDLSECEIDIF